MCYYNGRKVSKAEFIRLKELEKELGNSMDSPLGNGFDYSNWPIVLPTADGDIRITMAHWEFVADFVHSKSDLPAFRDKYITLNARGETLLQSSMYREAALYQRCLVLSSHFFEFQHIGLERIPYRVSLKEHEYFYMAGIWRQWTDKRTGKSGICFTIITTVANSFMRQIHNKPGKFGSRQVTVLPESLAYDWLFKPLTEAEITTLATHQFPAEGMQAYTVGKNFKTSDDPEKHVIYEHVPALTY